MLKRWMKGGETAGQAVVDAPKKKGAIYRPRGIETVCPEAGSDQQRFYLSPAQALGERLRDLPLILNGGEDQPSRLQWQFAIAVEAMNTLDNYPLQAVVNVHGEDKWDFHRAAYLRALVAGLGEWLNKHQLKDKKGNFIDVVSEGWANGVNLAPAKDTLIPVSGGIAEWHLCSELTKDQPRDYLHPEVYRLFMDSFAPDAHYRNPISGAVIQAREKMVKRLNAKGVSVQQAIGVIPVSAVRAQPQAAAPAPAPSQPDAGAQHQSPQNEAPRPKPRPEQKPQAKKTKPSTKAMKNAGIAMPEPATKPPERAPEPSASANGSVAPIALEDLVQVVRQRMDEGIITANQAGAIFHGTPNGAALIVPKGFDVIAQIMRVDIASVEAFAGSHMIDADKSFPNVVYRLHRQGRGWAKIKAGVLNPQISTLIFPEGLEVNPDIKVE